MYVLRRPGLLACICALHSPAKCNNIRLDCIIPRFTERLCIRCHKLEHVWSLDAYT